MHENGTSSSSPHPSHRSSGIPPGEEDRIFEPFVTGRTRGVGLGLTITRRVVELHRGSIRARNAEGGGAEFTLRIPKEG